MYYFLPGISDGIPGFGWPGGPPAAPPQLLSDWSNRPCTLPPSDSTRDTPVVMSTSRRSPRSTFLHWVSTTPPVMVMRLALVSKMAVSPVTTWSFCVTTTLPLASSRRIDELPPGPGAAACIGACVGTDLAAFALAGGGGVAGAAGAES